MITTASVFDQESIREDDADRIEPLEEKHFELLLPVAIEEALWLFTVAKINSAETFRKYFDTALEEKRNKRSYAFAYFNKQTGQYAGSTRYGNIEFQHKKVEIGWPWIHPSLQGSGFNQHCKY